MNPLSSLTWQDFLGALQNLMPRGLAWPREVTRTQSNVLSVIARMQALAHAAFSQLIDVELNPATTDGLLPEWEQDFGLPDPCLAGASQTYPQRIEALLAKIRDLGGFSRPGYIALAKTLGYAITVSEFLPATCGMACDDPCNGPQWRFAWAVNAPATTQQIATCDGTCNDPLSWWGNAELECAIQAHNRASRTVLFRYGGGGFQN
jgi:uncharacterized protein YmfQ (DUF2313 family)